MVVFLNTIAVLVLGFHKSTDTGLDKNPVVGSLHQQGAAGQVNAIADSIVVNLKKQKIKPLSVEGTGEGHWVLLDYGHVIIHVFYEPVREFFDLEGLWVDAKRITTPDMKKSQGSRN